jgi:hypothetical protein
MQHQDRALDCPDALPVSQPAAAEAGHGDDRAGGVRHIAACVPEMGTAPGHLQVFRPDGWIHARGVSAAQGQQAGDRGIGRQAANAAEHRAADHRRAAQREHRGY